MKTIRILHCADIHLGKENIPPESKTKERRAEVRRAFHSIADLAKERQADLFVVAGDLFDTVKVSEEVLCDARDTLADLYPIPVIMVSGNHDPATPESPYLRENFWSENVYIFTSSMKIVEIPQLGVRVLGAGFSSIYSTSTMLRRVSLPDDDIINIGVMHGSLVAEGAGSEYNPISARQIANSGLDYLALGHFHTRRAPEKAGKTTYAYPGCPEGQRFDEVGDEGVYLVDVSKESCNVEFIPVCIRKYFNEDIDISESESAEDTLTIIRNKLQALAGDEYAENLYRLTLSGIAHPTAADIDGIVSRLKELYFVEIKDRTIPWTDEASLAGENSLRGLFVKRMSELKGTMPEEKRIMALSYGLKALDGKINGD